MGPITGTFVEPGTTRPTVVESFSFDAGFFDEFGSTRIQWFDPKGELLDQRINSRLGIERFVIEGGNIASWRIEIVRNEPAGYGIDNLSFKPVGSSILFREHSADRKDGTWGFQKDEIPGFDHSAFQTGNLVYESHPGYTSGKYVSADGKTSVQISQINGVQSQHSKETFKHDSKTATTTVSDFEEIPIDDELAQKMRAAIEAVFGTPFQLIDYSVDGLQITLAPAVQKGANGRFTCVGLIEFAAEQAGHRGSQGFIRNVFESITVRDPRSLLPKFIEVPLLSPQLLNYAMKSQDLLQDAKQWVQGLFDPIDFVVTDPLGRRLGFVPGVGQVNEIPHAFYQGNGGVEQFLIPNAVPGTYTVTLIGVGSDAFAAVAALGPSQSFAGFLGVGQTAVKQIVVQPTVGSAGDVNGDGLINNLDVVALSQRLNKFTAGLGDPGDLDGDGFLSDADVALLTKLVSTITLGIADVNADSRIDCQDVAVIRAALGKRKGQVGFDVRADVVADGTINIRDLAFVTQKLPAGVKCP
jgi:hypothetical protein